MPARTAGVCFSAHPLTGREDHALIECCDGLGEKLVLRPIFLPLVTLANKASGWRDRQPGAPRRRGAGRTSFLGRTAWPLTDAALHLPSALRLSAEDIEWARRSLWTSSGSFSRAPSRASSGGTIIEEYTNADFKDGGVSAKVCSPLMLYSLYRDAMQGIHAPAYLKSIRLIPARLQGTATSIASYGRRLLERERHRNAPSLKCRALTKKALTMTWASRRDYGKPGPMLIPTNIKTVLPALPVAVALEKQYKLQLELARGYADGFLKQESRLLAEAKTFEQLEDPAFFRAL